MSHYWKINIDFYRIYDLFRPVVASIKYYQWIHNHVGSPVYILPIQHLYTNQWSNFMLSSVEYIAGVVLLLESFNHLSDVWNVKKYCNDQTLVLNIIQPIDWTLLPTQSIQHVSAVFSQRSGRRLYIYCT